MDKYHPQTVFSSIDRTGRYAYDNQPAIAVWNLAQLATALIQQLDDPQQGVEQATEIVHAMPALTQHHWEQNFRSKLGISIAGANDLELISDLLSLMAQNESDFTNTFRGLATGHARDLFTDHQGFDSWNAQWQARLGNEPDPKALMLRTNPAYIPRNHQIEHMIDAAVAGDYTLFHTLNQVLAQPFSEHPDHVALRQPPTSDQIVAATFCGT
ncbi:protein adenylyltransferase SelO family protein [Parasedimentitalea marina]|uniref:protein adenylyltransferase SelO family protein n=1 Tax=Parasedimentitalea marina TaxID=2483033 RepID=UPI003B847854